MAGVVQRMLSRLRGGDSLDARERSRRDRRLAMNGTLDQCRALLRDPGLDADTLGILARRGAHDIVEGVVRHPAFTRELGQWLLSRPTTTSAVRALILTQYPDHECQTPEPAAGFGSGGRFVADVPSSSAAPPVPPLTLPEPLAPTTDDGPLFAPEVVSPPVSVPAWPAPVAREDSTEPRLGPTTALEPPPVTSEDAPSLEDEEYELLVTFVERLAEDAERSVRPTSRRGESLQHRDDRVDRLLMELFGLEAAGRTFDRLAFRLSSSTPWGRLRGSLQELMDHGFDPEVIALAFHVRADWIDRFGAGCVKTHMSWRTAARFVTCFDPGTPVDEMQARLEAIIDHWLVRGCDESRTLGHFVARRIDDYATARECGGQVPLEVLYP